MPKSVQKAVEIGLPMLTLQRQEELIDYIQDELVILASQVNINSNLNLQTHQLPIIAQTIYDNFKSESIEDIILCFRKGAAGFYGQIFRLDGAVIIDWMQKYLEEKYTIVESKVYEQKREDAAVDYRAFQQRLEVQREKERDERQAQLERNKIQALKDFEYLEVRKQYTPISQEEIILREQRHKWRLECFDLITAKPNDKYLDFDEWLVLPQE